MFRFLRRPGLRGTLLGAAAGMLAFLVTRQALFSNLDEWMQDGAFAFRGPRPPRASVVIVGLDDATLDSLRKPLVYASPDLAEVVTFLKKEGAAAIGLDVVIPEAYSALKALEEGREGDATAMGKAILEAGNVVLPEWRLADRWLRPAVQWRFRAELDPSPTDFGFVNLTEDEDLFLRRQQLAARDPGDGKAHLQFALALVCRAYGWEPVWGDNGLTLNGDPVPLDDEQRLRINYFGPPETFPIVPMKDVLAAARGGPALSQRFNGAIVIIGTTARTQQDYHSTPFTNNYWGGLYGTRAGLMAGSEIHANIAATLVDRAYVRTVPAPMLLATLAAVGALLGYAYSRLNLADGLLLAVGHYFAWKCLCLFAFAWFSLRAEYVSMLTLGAGLYGLMFLQRWWTLRRMLGAVKSESIARLLEGDPEQLDRRGQDRIVTILFADVRGFTAFAENHSARDVVKLLNAYFSAVAPVVERHGGTLNQYMGDGMMVIFGAPAAQEDHALRAARAAAAMVERVGELHAQWEKLGFPGLRIGVGVNTGRAVTGMVGSARRLDYSAIGDTTNAAARIEARTRDFDVDILISRETYIELAESDRAALDCDPEPLELVVKGKSAKVLVHAVGKRPVRTAGSTTRPGAASASPAAAPGPTGDAGWVNGLRPPTHETAPGAVQTAAPPGPPPTRGPAAVATGEPGRMIGPYHVVEEVGRGGMGIVYRAIDGVLDRQIALKVMRPELAQDAQAKARFFREARATAKVEHDHIVPVYAADETADGVLYLAMPYLQGETLEALLARVRPLPLGEALRLAAEVAAGLAAAHSHGLIHRDVKPSNIWLERRPAPEAPRVKLLDFGLARLAGGSELTMSGAITGTPSYMSPEQARGQEVDARSDLFSLGTVLYRVVTGRLPFQAGTPLAVLRAIEEQEPVSPAWLCPDLPEALERLIRALLAKRPEDRPASATDVQRALRAMLQEHERLHAAPRPDAAAQTAAYPAKPAE